MAYKSTCKTLAKVAEDEPIFVLRAQDLSSPGLVEEWVLRNRQISKERMDEAMRCAAAMRQWPNRKVAD